MTTFSNPRFNALPCERMRGCTFADDFKTQGMVEANYGTLAGTGHSIDNGMTVGGAGFSTYDKNEIKDGYASIVVKFSTTTEAATDYIYYLLSNMSASDGFYIYIKNGAVLARHGDGAVSTQLSVDLDYADGEVHTITYTIDMNGGTHILHVDELTPDTDTTSISADIGDIINLSCGYHLTGTIYSARIFSGAKHTSCLTAEEHALYCNDSLTDFLNVPLAAYRCDDFGDDTTGNLIWDRSRNLNDATKGDGSTSSTFPTKDDLGYSLDGTTDYVSNLPALGTSYTVNAVTSIAPINNNTGYPAWHSDNDTSLTALLTSAGGFEGYLHNMVLCSKELTLLEENHVKYYSQYWSERGRAANYYNRLITENTAAFAAFYNSTWHTYRDYSNGLREGAATSITKNGFPDGITVAAGGSVVYDDDADIRHTNGTIAITGDFAAAATGTTYLLHKDENYGIYATATTIVLVGNSDTAIFTYTIDDNTQIAATWKDGAVPRLYIDGEYDSDASSTIVTGTAANDLYVGNDSTSSNESEWDIETVLTANEPLTDQEIKALYESSLLMTDDSGSPPVYDISGVEGIQPDPSLLALYDMETQTIYDSTNQVPNLAWYNRVVDGSMEKNIADIADWTADGAGTTLTKETASPYSGAQWMKCAYGSANDFGASQTILTLGKTYRAFGVGQGDTTNTPKMGTASTELWEGTSASSFQEYDELFIADDTDFALYTNSAGSGWVGFDNNAIYEFDNKFVDDCSSVNGAKTTGSGDWTASTNAVLTKVSTTTLNVESTSGNSYAYVAPTIAGHNYRIAGQFAGDGTVSPAIYGEGINDIVIGTSSSSFQDFDEEFEAADTELYFYSIGVGDAQFRNLILIDLDEGASTHSDSFSNALTDGDCEQTAGWTGYNSPDTFDVDAANEYKGTNCINIIKAGSPAGMYQTAMTIGKHYRLRGHVYITSGLDQIFGVYDGTPFGTPICAASGVDTWVNFDETFEATDTDIYFAASSESTCNIYLDDLILEQLDEHNTDATETNCTQAAVTGNMLDFNGTNAKVTGSTDVSPFEYQTHSIGCWAILRDPSLSTEQGIITNGSSVAATTQVLSVDSDTGRYTYYNGATNKTVNFTPTQDALNLISVSRTYDGTNTTATIYLNGVQVDTDTTAGAPAVTVTDFLIGYLNTTLYVDALIGLTSAYNEPKSAAFWLAQYNLL